MGDHHVEGPCATRQFDDCTRASPRCPQLVERQTLVARSVLKGNGGDLMAAADEFCSELSGKHFGAPPSTAGSNLKYPHQRTNEVDREESAGMPGTTAQSVRIELSTTPAERESIRS